MIRARRLGAVAPLLLAALAFAALGGPGRARAQAEERPTATHQSLAREAFEQGIASAQAGRWEEARDAFERSYALWPRPTALLNLSGARARTGQLVAAVEGYRRLLRSRDPEARSHVSAVEAVLPDLEARVPELTVRVEGLAPGDQVSIDDAPLPRAALAGPLPVDPGTHRLTIHRGGRQVAAATVELAEAARATVSLVAPPVPPPAEVARAAERPVERPDPLGPPRDAAQRRPLRRSPWLWTAVGVVLAGAAVAAFATTRDGASPVDGTLGTTRTP